MANHLPALNGIGKESQVGQEQQDGEKKHGAFSGGTTWHHFLRSGCNGFL